MLFGKILKYYDSSGCHVCEKIYSSGIDFTPNMYKGVRIHARKFPLSFTLYLRV